MFQEVCVYVGRCMCVLQIRENKKEMQARKPEPNVHHVIIKNNSVPFIPASWVTTDILLAVLSDTYTEVM